MKATCNTSYDKVLLTFGSVDETLKSELQMNVIDQYFAEAQLNSPK